MSATRPKPIITGAPGVPYAYSGAPIAAIALSGTTSEPSTGAPATAITDYLWTLAYKPPGSAAVIVSPTSSVCQLSGVDLPGTYLVHLMVTDDEGNVSLDKWYPKQDASTKLIEVPETTSIVEIAMESENAGLVLPGSYSRAYTANLNAWLSKVDFLYGNQAAVASPRTVWAVPYAGAEDADGSMGTPYNATSAAAGGFAGPLAQAVAALEALDVSDQPEAGLTLIMGGGTYTEALSITDAVVPWFVYFTGHVVLDSGSLIRYSAGDSGDVLAQPDLTLGPLVPGAHLVSLGNCYFDSPDVQTWVARLSYVAVSGDTEPETSLANGLELELRDCIFIGAFNLIAARVVEALYSQFRSTFVARSLTRAVGSVFWSDIGLVTTPHSPLDGNGLYSCGFESAVVFDGPAGSAQFDPTTAMKFFNAGGTFGTDASSLDFLVQNWKRATSGTPSITNIISDTQFATTPAILEFGVEVGSRVTIRALVSVVIDAADEFKVELYLTGATGAPLYAVCTQSSNLLGPGTFWVMLESTVVISELGDPGKLYCHYRSAQPGPVVDEDTLFDSTVDLEPAAVRAKVGVALNGGTMGASSEAILLNMSISYEGAS
jgi:hypothetical protein